MNFPMPQTQTIVFIWVFVALYFLFLLRQAIRSLMDIYDFFILSMVALVPALFVTFPGAAFRLSRIIGVEFPFVILFAILILFLFVAILQLIRRTNQLKKNIVDLTQSLALRYKEKDE